MNETKIWSADPLEWGHGKKILEIFLEPTCPFSAKAFSKLDDLLIQAGEKNLTIKIRLLSQPWHCFSPIATRSIIAASTTKEGKQAAHTVMRSIFENREKFILKDHCSGPNLDLSAKGILELINSISGIDVLTVFQIRGLENEIKWHTKYARQNGAHSTPTFMVDGIIMPDMNSGDTVEDWLKKLNLT